MKNVINFTIYGLFFSIYFFDGFLGDGLFGRGLHLIPGKLSWICELISIVITFYVLLLFAIQKKMAIPNIYLLLFSIFSIFVLAGIVLNSVPPGAIFAGMRRYLLFIPLFFLPAVYQFSEKEIQKQLKILLILGIIQIPFVIYQRFFLFRGLATGDLVTGSLLSSTVLTLMQLLSIAILTGFYRKKRLNLSSYLIFLLLLFIPTTLNETKATIVLAPVAVAVPILFSSGRILDFKKVFLLLTSTVLVVVIFMSIYSYFYSTDLMAFFDTSGKDRGTHSVSGYLYKGLTKEEIEDEVEPGRLDSLFFPFKLIKDPFGLIFGLGIGNVNASGLGQFKGEYTHFNKFGAGKIAAASMIWEIGLIGLSMYVIFFCLILMDGFKLRQSDSVFGAISLGWVAVICITLLSLFYANIFHIKAIGFMFFYGSGLVVSMRYRSDNGHQENAGSI